MTTEPHVEALRRTTPLFADAIFVLGKDEIDTDVHENALACLLAQLDADDELDSDCKSLVEAAQRILGDSGHEWGDTVDFVVMAYALHVLAHDERVTLNPEQAEAVTFRWRTLVQLTDWENHAPLRP